MSSMGKLWDEQRGQFVLGKSVQKNKTQTQKPFNFWFGNQENVLASQWVRMIR